jgi:hypothetical protein
MRKPWFTDECLAAVDAKHDALRAYLADPATPHLLQAYKRARQACSRICHRARVTFTQSVIKRANEAAHQGHLGDFNKCLGALARDGRPETPTLVHPTTHTPLTTGAEKAEAFAQLLAQTFNPAPSSPAPVPAPPSVPARTPLEPQIKLDDVLALQQRLKAGKGADASGMFMEYLKHGGKPVATYVLALFRYIEEHRVIPETWQTTRFTMLPKTVTPSPDPLKYRPIAQGDTVLKALTAFLLPRLEHHLLGRLLPAQRGFLKDRGTMDVIFYATQLQQALRARQQHLYIGFLDIAKAFDCVPAQALWAALDEYDTPPGLKEMVQLIYSQRVGTVSVNGHSSQVFDLTTGVKQGCLLSPLLFIVLLDSIIRKTLHRLSTTEREYWADQFIWGLFYADDATIFAPTRAMLVRVISAFDNELRLRGLHLNITKSHYMLCGLADSEPLPPPLTVNGESLKSVRTAVCLGFTMSADSKFASAISARIGAASRAYERLQHLLLCRKLSRRAKAVLWASMVLPTLLYSSECWAPLAADLRVLESFQLRCLRAMDGKRWDDYVPYTEYLHRFNLHPIEHYLKVNRLRWYGHMLRMTEQPTAPHVRALLGQFVWPDPPTGARRNFHTWQRQLDLDLASVGLTRETARDKAVNREDWRALINQPPKADGTTAERTCPACGHLFASRAVLANHVKRRHTPYVDPEPDFESDESDFT